MILRWVITGCLLLTPAARAAVTVAWKIPVSSLISGYQTHTKVHKLNKPPLPSPFFESADPLWDISQALSSRWKDPESLHSLPHSGLPPIAGSWTGEFIVWNQKSGLIVARGEENEIAALEAVLGFQKLPETFSTKVELIDTRTPEQPSRSLSLLARNHEKASAKTGAFKVTLTTTDVYLPLREVELTATWQTRDQVSCHVDASATVRDGIPFRFAKKDSEELLVTVTRVLPDGSPYLTGRSREVNGAIEPWPEEREAPIPPAQPLAGDLFIGWFPMTPPDTWGIDSRDLKKIAPPKEWRDRIHGSLFDLKPGLAEKGLFGIRFAGYDPFAGMGVIVADEQNVDLAGQLGSSTKCFLGRQTFWTESSARDTPGSTLGISCARTRQASISGKTAAGQDDFALSIAMEDTPSYAWNRLGLKYADHHDQAQLADFSLSTTFSLREENPVIIGRFDHGNEPSSSRTFSTTLFFY